MSTRKPKLTPKDLERQVANQIIEMMERDGLHWAKSWSSARPACNALTGRPYSGSNVLTTALSMMVNDWDDPRFMTAKQAIDVGAHVRKGERGTPILFFSTITKETDDGESRYRMARVFYLFNREQIEDLDDAKMVKLRTITPPSDPFERNAGIETFISNVGPKRRTGTAAYYMPVPDVIVMPPSEDFLDTEAASREENYYSTLLHELVHWTGHHSRLDRLDIKGKQSKSYAFEELVAELGSVMLGMNLGLQTEPREDNAAYLKSWMKRLKEDPKYLFEAASSASKAVQFMQNSQTPQSIAAE